MLLVDLAEAALLAQLADDLRIRWRVAVGVRLESEDNEVLLDAGVSNLDDILDLFGGLLRVSSADVLVQWIYIP